MMYFLIIFPLVCFAGFFGYIVGNNVNHTAFECLYFIWPLSLCTLVSLALCKLKKRWLFLFPAIINLLVIAYFYRVDDLNIMVQNDKWYQRGLPLPFEVSQKGEIDISKMPAWKKMTLLSRDFSEGKITQEEFDHKADAIREEEYKKREENIKKERLQNN